MRRDDRVPGPRGRPLVGTSFDLIRDQLGMHERAMREHGAVARLRLGPSALHLDAYGVFHPDGVRHVLGDGDRSGYTKQEPFFDEVAVTLGQSLLIVHGDAWRRQRRILQPLFTPRTVATYAEVMGEEAATLVDRWSAADGAVVDAHAEMIAFTLHVLGRVVFGADVGQAIRVARETFPVLSRRAFRRAASPLKTPAAWPTPGNRRARAARAALRGVVDAMVTQRRGADGDDLLGLLLTARDPETGGRMTGEQVRDEALTFLLAGHETTAGALTFALHRLGQRPDLQHLLAEEATAVVGDRRPTAADALALEQTRRVLKEVLRLYPPVYGFSRRAPDGDTICGHAIPPGAIVFVSPWATHRHPDFWADPERLDPDRFAPETEAERHRYAYLPFGGGPRSCIGEHFAMLEMTILLAMLLRALRLRTAPGSVRLDLGGLTLRPKDPVPVAVTGRRAPLASPGP